MIQYLCVEKDSIYTYISLELCRENLRTAISQENEEFYRYSTPKCCLLQITHGMNFLHDKMKVQHRDIKPQNILWKHHNNEIRFIISDFDLGHFVEGESSHRAMYGTMGWTAPELWNKGERTTAVDIFSLGCVFYYVLTIGRHPFGSVANMKVCQQNIDDDKFSLRDLNQRHDPFVVALAEDLIRQMIDLSASKRPDAVSILKHPLFWDNGDMVNFYHKIGDNMEDMKSSSIKRLKESLEHDATIVFQGNWKDSLDKIVRNDLSRSNGGELCRLLRAVRDKIVHCGRFREELGAIYQNSPEGVVQYYNSRFPKLLIYTFRVYTREISNS